MPHTFTEALNAISEELEAMNAADPNPATSPTAPVTVDQALSVVQGTRRHQAFENITAILSDTAGAKNVDVPRPLITAPE